MEWNYCQPKLEKTLVIDWLGMEYSCASVRLKFQGFHAFHACALHILTRGTWGGAGAYNTIFKIELLVKIILSKNLNKKNVLESFFYCRLISFPLFLDCCLTKKEYKEESSRGCSHLLNFYDNGSRMSCHVTFEKLKPYIVTMEYYIHHSVPQEADLQKQETIHDYLN